jgi:L-aspartate oxidase
MIADAPSPAESITAWEASADLVVVGTGVAGLTAALRAAGLGLRVVAVTKSTVEDGNTRWAQGGVAVVLPGTRDTVDAHVTDTLAAGAGLCDDAAVRTILTGGPAAVSVLRTRGVTFDGSGGNFERSREGGHRAFRVIHERWPARLAARGCPCSKGTR